MEVVFLKNLIITVKKGFVNGSLFPKGALLGTLQTPVLEAST